nr:divergent polysaccharide deacetylase family protein [Gemmobacter straminiformis]
MPGDAPRLIQPDTAPLAGTPAPDLPRIGDATAPAEPAPTPATALELFARPFDNPEAKPLFAILLRDDGAAGTDRETLAALPFPVTFVLDPLAPGAADAAAIYRAAGQEVVMLANAIPANARPGDIEQSLQALDLALPDAVAVMGGANFPQDSQQLAAAVVPIIGAQGRGLVTLDKGLNALDQVARREGVPHAAIFRMLDGGNETVPVIRRYLDRAAFRAAQEGAVVVMGSTNPDTIAAILQWNVEGRAASVALAPISAVMQAPAGD